MNETLIAVRQQRVTQPGLAWCETFHRAVSPVPGAERLPLHSGRHRPHGNAPRIKRLPAYFANQIREVVERTRIEGAGTGGRREMNGGPKGPNGGWIPGSGAREGGEIMKPANAMFHNRRWATEASTGAVRRVGIQFGFAEAAHDSDAKIVVAMGCSSANRGAGCR